MASQENIIIPSEFDVTQLTYGDVKKLDSGGKFLYLSHKNSPLVMQTCECIAPFGINTYSNEDGKSPSYSIDFSFKNMEQRESLKKLYEVLDSIDKSNVEKGIEHSSDWLNKKKSSRDVIEALYTPIIKQPNDEKYSPTFKVKIPQKDGMFTADIFNEKGELVNLKNYLDGQTKGARCTAIIQCTGVWIAGGKFGSTWKLVQMKMTTNKKISGYCIRDVPEDKISSDDIIENDNSSEIDVPIDIRKSSEDSEQHSDGDGDGDGDGDEIDNQDESDESDDEPVPVVVKKKVRK
jgi:hypothetical protein